MRLAELEEDYRCKNGAPHIEVSSGILIHGAHMYTNKMFRFFQKEFVGGIGVRMKEIFSDNELCICEAMEEGRQRVYEVFIKQAEKPQRGYKRPKGQTHNQKGNAKKTHPRPQTKRNNNPTAN
ncbi:hypothetical protein Ddye_024880 [Dipteronia dyeriana]|uniref:Uncharacterized protein n=1 Tax=Dipteronia dyeriana TaxID=168575 RepID=A0AAD9TVV3_9ROSI|nr:hypothetical protein Ddye_024880 [Dipteronia dyeriana]